MDAASFLLGTAIGTVVTLAVIGGAARWAMSLGETVEDLSDEVGKQGWPAPSGRVGSAETRSRASTEPHSAVGLGRAGFDQARGVHRQHHRMEG